MLEDEFVELHNSCEIRVCCTTLNFGSWSWVQGLDSVCDVALCPHRTMSK